MKQVFLVFSMRCSLKIVTFRRPGMDAETEVMSLCNRLRMGEDEVTVSLLYYSTDPFKKRPQVKKKMQGLFHNVQAKTCHSYSSFLINIRPHYFQNIYSIFASMQPIIIIQIFLSEKWDAIINRI